MSRRTLGIILVSLLLSGLMACSRLGYYAQSVRGQLGVMAASQEVDEILDDPGQPAKLKERLRFSQQLLAYAHEDLGLENDGSYLEYADIGRHFVVWNVVATPELSLEPKTWCFMFAGCVPYRGYFEEQDALAFASELREDGLDVDVYGVPAYSTLGWLDDPLLNTFLFESDIYLAELIFHELAHQRLYLKDHGDFNEAFAVVVARHGADRWISSQDDPVLSRARVQQKYRQKTFFDLFDETRNHLTELYASGQPDSQMLASKQQLLDAFAVRYRALLQGWGATEGESWLGRGLNNARFAAAMTYRKLVPAFEALWEQSGESPRRFYRAAEELSRLPEVELQTRLKTLSQR